MGTFSIHPESGQIRLTKGSKLDREEKAEYNLIVQAFDNYEYGFSTGQSRNAFTRIKIEILDINDESPEFEKVGRSIN